jgi:hypothetical protein
MRSLIIGMIAALLTVSARAEQEFTLPAEAAEQLQMSSISGEPVGAKHRDRFTECDTKDTCDSKPLKHGCSKDLNRNTALLRLKSNAIFFDAKMALDADGSPLSKAGQGTNQPETSLRYRLEGSPSVNADAVPFIVLPAGSFANDLGLALGDLVAVVHGSKRVFALVADFGPTCKIGEGSIQAHERLGHRVCKERDRDGNCIKLREVGIEKEVLYFVFPGTHADVLEGLTPDNVNRRIEEMGSVAWDSLVRSNER